LVRLSFDDLFDCPSLCAPPNIFSNSYEEGEWKRGHFSTAVMAITPSKEDHRQLWNSFQTLTPESETDFLNHIFKGICKLLPEHYSTEPWKGKQRTMGLRGIHAKFWTDGFRIKFPEIAEIWWKKVAEVSQILHGSR